MASSRLSERAIASHISIDRADLDHKVTSGTRWFTWLLSQGFDVTAADLVDLGYSSGLPAIVLSSLQIHGWLVEVVSGKGTKADPLYYRALARPDGSTITPLPHSMRPPLPVSLMDAMHKRKDDERAQLYAETRQRQKAKRSSEIEPVPVVKAKRVSASPREALIRVSPDAPTVGTPLRVGMVAEHPEGTVVALHDETGRVWFARLDDGGAHG